MPERTFGRTVRFRRTKLGLSQTKLAELVGRSVTTIRSWERDKSVPTDPKALAALAAILGVDERSLFEKAGQAVPAAEDSPTIEEALATLDPDLVEGTTFGTVEEPDETSPADDEAATEEPAVVDDVVTPAIEEPAAEEGVAEAAAEEFFEAAVADESEPEVAEVTPRTPAPSYAAPPTPYSVVSAVPPAHEPSYMEDSTQRQLYRVRNLATVVVLVALGIAFLWALSEGLGALGDWWDEFFGNLRL
jgi:transcriptional regulator with XRE-family HTH domain